MYTVICIVIYTAAAVGYVSMIALTARCERHYQEDPHRYVPGCSQIYVITAPRPKTEAAPSLISSLRSIQRRTEHAIAESQH